MNKHVMDKAIGETRLDRNTQGIIGKGVDRYEGPLKVSGRATYAYENLAGEDVAYGFVVPAPIGRGAIKSVDTSKAESAPGVLAVISGDKILRASSQPMAPAAQTIDGEVFHYNQPLAIVIAESPPCLPSRDGRIRAQARSLRRQGPRDPTQAGRDADGADQRAR